MEKYSLVKAIKVIFDLISKTPSMFLFIIIGILLLILTIVGVRKNKKINKWVFIIGWLYLTLFLLINFFPSLLKITDNLINDFFIQIFFPNLSTYIIMLVLLNVIFLLSFIIKNTIKVIKIINTIFYILIMLLSILILTLINKNNINVYEKLTVYSNNDLLLLIQTSTILFCIWFIVILLVYLVNKIIIKSDKLIKDNDEDEEIETLEL